MKEKDFEEELREMRIIKIDLIAAYNHEMQELIGIELQQLLVMLYFRGDEFAKREIQMYCFELLRDKNKLCERHRINYRNIIYLENCSFG
jgi:hypothetical protein